MSIQQLTNRGFLGLVRLWCFLRYPRICVRTARRIGSLPNPATPLSDVDKFLWRKIFDHSPMFATACDKLAAKKYALSVYPDLKTAEVLWVGDGPEEIPGNVLSGNIVLKANHGSRWNVMILDGQTDLTTLHEKARSWLSRSYGRAFGEWGYTKARRCLFVERMLLEGGQPIPTEYKFHVSGGRTSYVYVTIRDDKNVAYGCYLDRDGLMLPRSNQGIDSCDHFHRPDSFKRMVTAAERLAAQLDYIRCDLYDVDGEIYFSELTVYPLSGQGGGNPDARYLRNVGWDLRKSWFLTEPQRGWRKAYSHALRRRLDEIGPC